MTTWRSSVAPELGTATTWFVCQSNLHARPWMRWQQHAHVSVLVVVLTPCVCVWVLPALWHLAPAAKDPIPEGRQKNWVGGRERAGVGDGKAGNGNGVAWHGESDNWMRKQKPHCSTKCQSTRTKTSSGNGNGDDDGDAQSLISIVTARWRHCCTT